MPPDKPILVDEDGNQVKNKFGPFFEGEKISLTCEVSGGSNIHSNCLLNQKYFIQEDQSPLFHGSRTENQ